MYLLHKAITGGTYSDTMMVQMYFKLWECDDLFYELWAPSLHWTDK